MDWAAPSALEALTMSLVCHTEGISFCAASGFQPGFKTGFKQLSPSSSASSHHQARGGSDGTTCLSHTQHTRVPAEFSFPRPFRTLAGAALLVAAFANRLKCRGCAWEPEVGAGPG